MAAGETAAQTADGVACGEVYVIQQGDTLSGVAGRVTPEEIPYADIVAFNPGAISDPNRIDVGLALRIPCAAGVEPPAAAEAAVLDPTLTTAGTEADPAPAEEPAPATVAAVAPADAVEPEVAAAAEAGAEELIARDPAVAAPTPPEPAVPAPPAGASLGALTAKVDILTGGSYAPYVARDLPHGGFSTHVIDTVFGALGDGVAHRIDVIDDWSSHLRILLAGGKYDLAYPWFRPNCAEYDRLGDEGRWRCDNLRFSAPLHEVVVTFFARAGEGASLATVAALEGKRICRPAGYFTHDLAARGLMPPYAERVEPRTPGDCFQMLIAGEADLVTVNADVAEAAVAELGAAAAVEEVDALATIETLHLVGMKANAKTRPTLLRFNRGLAQLIQSGAWYDIAAIHLR
ncbi:MAG: transporter substrate-binding domain-containing protein [Pseudomonadota bacterium]